MAYLTRARAVGRYPTAKIEVCSGSRFNWGGVSFTITGEDGLVSVRGTKGTTGKPSTYEVGLALCAHWTITINRKASIVSSHEQALVPGTKIIIYSGFGSGEENTAEYQKLGEAYIENYDNDDDNAGVITASDVMQYTEVDFNPTSLTYPISLSGLLAEAFRQSGLSLTMPTLNIESHCNKEFYKAETPKAEGMNGCPFTCREIIARIAAMQIGCIFIDANGQPQLYSYASASISLTDSDIISMKLGGSYYNDLVRVFKSEEKMLKSTANFGKIPYAPMFDDMDDIDSGSAWFSEISAYASIICDHTYYSAETTIKGIGAVDLGQYLTYSGILANSADFFITGIEYELQEAHFIERLYSFGFSEEDYMRSKSNYKEDEKIVGGVGEWMDEGHTSERFNDYDDNISELLYDHIEGKNNQSRASSTTPFAWEGMNFVGGCDNYLIDGYGCIMGGRNNSNTDYTYCVIIHGDYNSIVGGFSSIISGTRNTILDNFYQSLLIGQNNNCYGINQSIVYGQYHAISSIIYRTLCGGQSIVFNGGAYDSIVTGANNIISYAAESVICGTYNEGDFRRSIICGNHNYGYAEDSVVCGSYADINNNLLIIAGGGSSTSDRVNVFTVSRNGDVTARQYLTSGRDYAEFFEWEDGNPDSEYRRRMLVALDGDKIIPAQGDDFIGIISENPAVLGNMTSDKLGNPKYAPVGLFGRLVVRDNGTCRPNGYVSARDGIAVASIRKTSARVLRRIDETHVEVLLK